MTLGLRNAARSPGSIVNDQNIDSSGAQKNLGGTGASYDSIVATSTAVTPLQPRSVIRVANTSASFQYLFVGSQESAPAGAPDITNGIALSPNSVDVVFTDDTPNLVVKSSAATVQIAILKP